MPKSWGNFQVPGQWAQQGYDIPQDKTVAMAREFTIPAEWAGYRIFLRFDAIHGGTTLLAEWQAAGLQRESLYAGRMGNHRCGKSGADEPARSRNEGGHRLGAAVVLQ